MRSAVILIDHGSRLAASNALVAEAAAAMQRRFSQRFPIVEPAHMDLAEPSLAAAYARCVQRGAGHLIICPYFLSPGRHWAQDIPRLAAAAQAEHPGTSYHIAEPLGLDELILDLLAKRIDQCEAAAAARQDCPVCREASEGRG